MRNHEGAAAITERGPGKAMARGREESGAAARRAGRFVALAALLAALLPCAAPSQQMRPSFDLLVTQPPVVATIDGASHIVYELHLTNFASTDLALTRIEVLDADRGTAQLAAFDGAALTALLGRPGLKANEDVRIVPPGMRVVAYFWIPLARTAESPGVLTHRVRYRALPAEDAGDGVGDGMVEGGRVAVRAGPTRRAFGPPLHGGPWVAVYDPSMARGHRRVLLAHDGHVHIPARFAIDWMRVDEQGRLARGDASRVANHYGYCAEVLAVANATVVDVRDSMADGETVSHVRHGLENESGNHITLDLGDGRYVSYEHLMAGSIRVAVGDSVRRGQIIAHVGYTGDSSSPHLHMHVSDGASPLAGEGAPWALERFVVLGRYPSLAAFAAGGRWSPPVGGRAITRTMELPGANVVVQFDSASSARYP